MKKIFAIVLVVLLCVSFVAYAMASDSPSGTPTEGTTEQPTLETYEGTLPEIERPTLNEDIQTPDEMPTKPESDYILPPGEGTTPVDKADF